MAHHPSREATAQMDRVASFSLGSEVPDMRRNFEKLARASAEGEWTKKGGVACLMARDDPRPSVNVATLLYFHGGGYVFGSPQTHLASASALTACANTHALLPRYRLAPEHVWPAMLEDALVVLDAVSGPVVVAGDSAGGHLALSTALARPGRCAALILLSPNTDRLGNAGSRRRNAARDAMNDAETDNALAQLAFGMAPADHPDASPARVDLHGLPPLFIAASTAEILLDDALLLTQAAAAADVPTQLRLVPHMPHMWTLWPELPEAKATFEAAGAFIRDVLGQ